MHFSGGINRPPYETADGYLQPLPVVNRLLVEAGAQPLTNLVDGYDENGIRVAN